MQCLLQIWTNTWLFSYSKPSSPARSLGTCQLIPISPTGILNIGSTAKLQRITARTPTPIFNTEHAIKLQEFEWLLVWCHIPSVASAAWTQVYNHSRFTNTEQRLFDGVGNYEFYIGATRGIAGKHKIMSTNTKSPQDFLQNRQSLESTYNPHIYLMRGQGFLWYMMLTRAQIHTNALSIWFYPSDHWELSKLLCKEVHLPDNNDNIVFTYGAYYNLLSNAAHEVRISPTPWLTGKLAQHQSDKKNWYPNPNPTLTNWQACTTSIW